MISKDKDHVCPIEKAGSLDGRLRRWIHNPKKILAPYLKDGMTVLDFGCGPGFFSIEMAKMVGPSGKIIASDLQEGMLELLKNKISGSDIEGRIALHKCEESSVGVSEQVDFILLFFVVHELPDASKFFKEVIKLLKPGGQILIAEPPFHVSKKYFEESIQKAINAGFTVVRRPRIFFSRSVVLKAEIK